MNGPLSTGVAADFVPPRVGTKSVLPLRKWSGYVDEASDVLRAHIYGNKASPVQNYV